MRDGERFCYREPPEFARTMFENSDLPSATDD